jgi:hypothetical protein
MVDSCYETGQIEPTGRTDQFVVVESKDLHVYELAELVGD